MAVCILCLFLVVTWVGLWSAILSLTCFTILYNPGVTHSVPNAFIIMNALGTEWLSSHALVTEDVSHNVEATSHDRRCDVITSLRCIDVHKTLC